MASTTSWRGKSPGRMVYLSPSEALRVAASLCQQVESGNPNNGRPEFRLADGSYLSIAVLKEERNG